MVTGGRRKNLELHATIKDNSSADIVEIDQMGFDGDMVEAHAFAYLAARVAHGLPTSFLKTTGVATPMSGGVLSKG